MKFSDRCSSRLTGLLIEWWPDQLWGGFTCTDGPKMKGVRVVILKWSPDIIKGGVGVIYGGYPNKR